MSISINSIMQAPEVIFSASQSFWTTRTSADKVIRTRTSVDIVIAEHPHSVIEIMTYAPAMDMEAHRLYLSDDILTSRLDQAQLQESLRALEALLRREDGSLMGKIVREAKVQHILNRLSVEEYSVQDRTFRVGFRLYDSESADRLLMHMPAGLNTLVSPVHSFDEEDGYRNISGDLEPEICC
ncbi:hypothetical protein B484DRAFT_420465 [Ochromonadaceae sp. CCMP2298]|nr:hypothetical protein B484DRAFT_420465 [Ochromonadaceae sp. CCMP2298]